ncbi:hypothetical protein [Streptomyces sp. NPDC093109]|uniref:hypothetical protein n=1 Tax=Streptomyces sp. NPDC093109 TaxID=3154977 RepID=UPI00344B7B6D
MPAGSAFKPFVLASAPPDEPRPLPMSGVGGEDSGRGIVFPPRIRFDYRATVAPYVPTTPGWDERGPIGNGVLVPPAAAAPVPVA